MEATGRWSKLSLHGVVLACFMFTPANLSAGRFFGLITGIFILYDPIKTLSKIQL